jgi:hypothetical protein
MGEHVQSVVLQGRVYVGGGYAGYDSDDHCIVMEYDTRSGRWTKLQPYRTSYFAKTVIDNQLVLVGGYEHGHPSKVLGVWRAESREWAHPYPEMPTARSRCSVVTYKEWLAVAGGWGDRAASSVQFMNIRNKQWYSGPPTPTPWDSMKAAIVGDTCYFMGGDTESQGPTAKVYRVSIPALISQRHSHDSRERGEQHQIWKEVSGLQTIRSTPLSICGFLLAVGGKDKDGLQFTSTNPILESG